MNDLMVMVMVIINIIFFGSGVTLGIRTTRKAASEALDESIRKVNARKAD